MVVSQSTPGGRPSKGNAAPGVRVAIWAAMLAAIFWTLIYQTSREGGDIPEFVYVNF